MGEKYFNYKCGNGDMDRLCLGSIREGLSARRKRGVTLIEAAMVLAILAIVVAGIMIFYTNADGSRKTSATISELGAIQQGVRSLYSGQSSYSGVSNTVLVNTEALPSKMIAGSTIRHSHNGPVTVAAANAGGGTSSGFSVVMSNIPSDACSRMVTQDLGRGLYSVAVGGTTRSITGTPPPFDPATAGSSCGSAANTITWVFR
ncbi:type 4 pilus major pilin [Roseibium sp. RKSG952]|uniref:type 4 pilus major pilin n=1 Tax=Roseibium sp. RKSG952 TaxID=2529384 RepID=UPI0012BB6A40|nr:type 4 pilus major pilin [Roseibium sp. RKSG952]MTH95488.1 prepilin-type N-terminal cleavage/methylation domain-containing protein [Roseibium sp. RKSG952]